MEGGRGVIKRKRIKKEKNCLKIAAPPPPLPAAHFHVVVETNYKKGGKGGKGGHQATMCTILLLPWLLTHTISQFDQVGTPLHLHVVVHGRLNAVDSVIVVDSWNN